ncbi:MAG TPA: hypothetical protein VNC84_00550 [Gammaproteobacteria bacterium]|jgi:TPR repeat protein|nr:hypothetical protein [Gammaproteobacteria bacterium]
MKKSILCFSVCWLTACAHLANESAVQQGQRYFEQGYYKRAMHTLLPAACDGNAKAEYAVGYMYYYGYGVGQDTDVGYVWIQRSAHQHYQPAVTALNMMHG